MSVRVPGVKPGVVARLPFAVAALCFLAAAVATWNHRESGTAAGAWWFYGGLAGLAVGAVTTR